MHVQFTFNWLAVQNRYNCLLSLMRRQGFLCVERSQGEHSHYFQIHPCNISQPGLQLDKGEVGQMNSILLFSLIP